MEKKRKGSSGPGSVQQQTQKNEQYGKEKSKDNEFAIVPASQLKGSNADKDRRVGSAKPVLKNIDDEKIIPGLRRKNHSFWNSVNFERD